MTVALFTHEACLGHDTGAYHPERADRLRSVLAALSAEEFSGLLRRVAPRASEAELALAHPESYVETILAIRPAEGAAVALDPDTVMSAGSAEAARHAAGAAIAAVDAVQSGEAGAAFVAARPPGHHAEPARAMGFCLFNNAAIAAYHARRRWGLRRIAVADFDVHHGNGTQAIFWSDPALFYASSHQSPCYPGTGLTSERGIGRNVLNAPLPPGADGTAFRAAWDQRLLPALDAFAPDLLIVSAGFDAHRADPLAALCVDTEDFHWLTGRLVALADAHCGGRLVSVLEGGYELRALGDSAAAHVRALLRR